MCSVSHGYDIPLRPSDKTRKQCLSTVQTLCLYQGAVLKHCETAAPPTWPVYFQTGVNECFVSSVKH